MRLQSKLLTIAGVALVAATADAKPLVRAKPFAHASLTSDGPWLANPTDPDPRERSALEIVDDTGKRVLVTTYCDSGFLQVYLDRAGLSTIAIVDTELHPLGPKSQARARLGQGMRIDKATAQRDGTSRVAIHWEWDDATVDVTGVVPTAALGTRHERGMVDGSVPPPRRPKIDIELPASFQLLDGPAGHVFATLNGKKLVPATTVTTSGAYTLVTIDLMMDGFALTGWIRTQLDKPTPVPRDGGLLGGLLGGVGGDYQHPVDVYDAIGGRVIGRLYAGVRPQPAGHLRGWTRYDLATQFGIAPVWAKDADIQSGRAAAPDGNSAPDDFSAPAVTPDSLPPATATRITFGHVRVTGGYDAAVAQRYMRRQRDRLIGCYDALPWNARAAISFDLVLSLDASGAASDASAPATNPPSAMTGVASCLVRVFTAVTFPKPTAGNAVRISTSLAFSRQ